MQTLVVVRHAATAWNENRYCQGRKDVPLSPQGEEQLTYLREALADMDFDRVFASPLSRAQQTARLLGHEPEILDELAEIDRGHWEGHAPEEIKRRWGKLVKAWYDDPAGLAMPGGEAFDDLWARARRALRHLEESGGRCILVCGHKAVNRVLIACALKRPTRGVWQIPQPQACRSVLRRDDGAWRAETIGDVVHLPPGLRSDT